MQRQKTNNHDVKSFDLFIDVGNSRIKIAYFQNNDLKISYLDTDLATNSLKLFKFIKKSFQDITIKSFVVCSVVPRVDWLFKKMNQEFFGIDIHFLNADVNKTLIPSYLKSEIGADIVACSVYASEKYQNAIVVSLGTALVISLIENKELKGAIISNGLFNSYQSLIGKTAKVSGQNLFQENKVLGTNTQEALNIGFINGYRHMIKGFLQELNKNYKILLTGGDAVYFKNDFDALYVPNMVLEGIKIEYDK